MTTGFRTHGFYELWRNIETKEIGFCMYKSQPLG